jgi:hypothetical protein
MSIQETGRDERLGGDAPLRISARTSGDVNGRSGARGLPAFARSHELWVLLIGTAAVLIAAAVDSGFGAQRAWTLVVVLAAAYILRRR